MNEIQPIAVKPKQGGYTIVELSIALTIIAILIVSGIVGISAVLRSNKAICPANKKWIAYVICKWRFRVVKTPSALTAHRV